MSVGNSLCQCKPMLLNTGLKRVSPSQQEVNLPPESVHCRDDDEKVERKVLETGFVIFPSGCFLNKSVRACEISGDFTKIWLNDTYWVDLVAMKPSHLLNHDKEEADDEIPAYEDQVEYIV